jgi:hypothetical protein
VDVPAAAAALKLADALCRLLDHRFGGSVRSASANAWVRAVLGLTE